MPKGVSLFSSAGVAEIFLSSLGIDIVVANEIVKERAELYQYQYPHSKMICGDILNDDVYNSILKATPQKLDFLIASPPCQGMSVAGKNRFIEQMVVDPRNSLVLKVVDFIQKKHPDYILIENVPTFLKLQIAYKGKIKNVVDILNEDFSNEYVIDARVYDAQDYGVPQRRKRAIVRMYKHNLVWNTPTKCPHITLRDAIGDLPSIEAGEKSSIKWHFARQHSPMHIECMKHTPTGHSAFENDVYFPRNKDGNRVKGYNTTYRRINWDEPAPTITIRNDAISSQLNVHPGRPLKDGTYSDARVLTPLELMILNSIPRDWNIPDDTPEILIRKCIGESIPPLLIKKIVEQIEF